MQYSPAALKLLGYAPRNNSGNDYISRTMRVWYKFNGAQDTSEFAWVNTPDHSNENGVTHTGALLTYMDYAMSTTVHQTTGRWPYVVELNNKFTSSARIIRWLFASVTIITINDEIIELRGRINAHNPNGMLVLQSTGTFNLPKLPKMLDNDE